jgi:ERCC4-related helicase
MTMSKNHAPFSNFNPLNKGLDIAEVDLIVFFEAIASPIRYTQRCGRTGRKRSGRVVMLVTEGQEEEKIRQSNSSADTISKVIHSHTTQCNTFTHTYYTTTHTLIHIKKCNTNT